MQMKKIEINLKKESRIDFQKKDNCAAIVCYQTDLNKFLKILKIHKGNFGRL